MSAKERLLAALHGQAEELPSFGGAIEWLNSPPLTANDLKGKVVVVEFWTYSCINWLRTLPYVRAWDEKYREHGLVTIGVHSPEFSFEHDIDNIRRAAKEMNINYPIAVDTDFAIWRAFENNFWPALYFVDAQEHLRHHHFGEGEYAPSERMIQRLLTEAGAAGIGSDLVEVDARGIEAAADWGSLRSPETYVGYERGSGPETIGAPVFDARRAYAAPEQLRLNRWALSGEWTVGPESIASNSSGGRIDYSFHARDLHLVMGPAAPGTSVRFRVRLDGEAPGADHGIDVDAEGNGLLDEPRLYQLVRQDRHVHERRFEIEFEDPGAQAYVFTFG